jgi:hypothetical protein
MNLSIITREKLFINNEKNVESKIESYTIINSDSSNNSIRSLSLQDLENLKLLLEKIISNDKEI